MPTVLTRPAASFMLRAPSQCFKSSVAGELGSVTIHTDGNHAFLRVLEMHMCKSCRVGVRGGGEMKRALGP